VALWEVRGEQTLASFATRSALAAAAAAIVFCFVGCRWSRSLAPRARAAAETRRAMQFPTDAGTKMPTTNGVDIQGE